MADTMRRARELAAGGCNPKTIETLLAAEGYAEAHDVMTDEFVQDLKLIAQNARASSSTEKKE